MEQTKLGQKCEILINRRSSSNRAKGDCKLLRGRVNVVDPVGVGFDVWEVANAIYLALFTVHTAIAMPQAAK